MAVVEAIVVVAAAVYSYLDKYVFQPSTKRAQAKSLFNNTDFPRKTDNQGRAPLSIFQKLNNREYGTEGYDKACLYTGSQAQAFWSWAGPTFLGAPWLMGDADRKGFLHGYVDSFEGFNADSIFELYAFMVYWHGARAAEDKIFHGIINPMYNLGLKNLWAASNEFTAPDRRFFMLYYDFMYLKYLAQAPLGTYNFTVYTQNGSKAHSLDAKGYAISLSNLLGNIPYSSRYFVDGLSNQAHIIEREKQLLLPEAEHQSIHNFMLQTTAAGNFNKPPISQNNSASSPKAANNTKNIRNNTTKYLIYAAIGLVVAFLSLKIFTKFKKS